MTVGKGTAMAIAVQEKVEEMLAGFERRLSAVLDAAMSDWLATPGRARFLYPRTRANIIFDHIIRHALEEFDGDSDRDVKAIREAQSVKFLFRSEVLARIKKGNASGVGQNITTQTVLDFVEPQRKLAILPDVHRIEIVYQLNVLGTGYEEIAVVARDRRTRIWSYPLGGRDAAVVPMPTRLPPDLQPPAVTPRRRPAARPATKAE